MKITQFLALQALLLPAAAGFATAQSFNYPDFTTTTGLTQVLTTANLGPILRVHDTTGVAGDNMGAVWYSTPVPVVNGFDTTFQFQITGAGSGDGMAFVVQNDPNPGYNGMIGANAIGRHASALGYGNFATSLPGDSIENSLAVELDHFLNGNQPTADPIMDPDSNHISVHTGGIGENRPQESFSIGRAPSAILGADLNNGSVHTLRVVYVPGTLDVYLNGTLVLTTPYSFTTGGTWIDTNAPVGGLNLIGGTSAYVGITASSGGSTQAHDLLSWSFDIGGSMGTNFCSPAVANSTGGSAQIAGSSNMGVGSGLHVDMNGGPTGELGYFLIGTAANMSPSVMLGNGNLCLTLGSGNAIGRYNVGGTAFNSLGRFDASGIMQNLVGTSVSGPGYDVPASVPITGTPTIMTGSTWHFQGWFRDTPAGMGQSNTTDSLTVMF